MKIKIRWEIEERKYILARLNALLDKVNKNPIKAIELDRAAEALILKFGGKCSFKGYEGFPACLCVSINEEIVHALPSERILKEGDIVSLDLGIQWKGFHTDMALTLGVGKITDEARKIIKTTREALEVGIKEVKPGNHFGDIGFTVQQYAENRGFNVVRDLCGHGIGKELHEDPQIMNFGEKGRGPEIKGGMVFCIEPMITVGSCKIKRSKDGFGWLASDDSLACHFEQTIAVIENGCRVLTKFS